MKINRLYLGILIINILLFLIVFDVFNIHPEVIGDRFFLVTFLLIIGAVGIVVNVFNAFPKEKK